MSHVKNIISVTNSKYKRNMPKSWLSRQRPFTLFCFMFMTFSYYKIFQIKTEETNLVPVASLNVHLYKLLSPILVVPMKGEMGYGRERSIMMEPHQRNMDITLYDNGSAAEEKYYRLVSETSYNCSKWTRVGSKGDGGWNMCIDEVFKPKNPCLVYSFGICNDYSFDDEMALTWKCTVRSFDPSMHKRDNVRNSGIHFYGRGLAGKDGWLKGGWKMCTLGTLLEKFGEQNKILDYLKMDIEYSEWNSLIDIMTMKLLKNIKQLAIETHTKDVVHKTPTVQDYMKYTHVLNLLNEAGFKAWSKHDNEFGLFVSKHTGKIRTCCHELVFVNTNFI